VELDLTYCGYIQDRFDARKTHTAVLAMRTAGMQLRCVKRSRTYHQPIFRSKLHYSRIHVAFIGATLSFILSVSTDRRISKFLLLS
jgi:hypothetical protein